MSWLARSFANSIRINDHADDEDAEPDHHHHHHHTTTSEPNTPSSSSASSTHNEEEDPSRGVKEDLSELKQTLSRQLWGVASFLAPPPPPPPPPTPSHSQAFRSAVSDWKRCEPSDQSVSGDNYDASDSLGVSGVRSDFSDIRDKAVSGISKIALNLYSFGSSDDREEQEEEEEEFEFGNAVGVTEAEEEEGEEEFEFGNAVGVTEEVLAFARNIAMHPETWLDFPMDEEEDTDDFDMSDTQQEHALAVEYLAPRLAALRIELCPCHMSQGYFWKVYFVLLHSRLNKHDAELLLTPQIMAARALWMQELQNKIKQEQDWSRRCTSYSKVGALQEDFVTSTYYDTYYEDMPLRTFSSEDATFSGTADFETERTTDFETEKHPIVVTEMQIVDKSVIEEKSVIRIHDKDLLVDNDDDEDDWLKDENMDIGGYCTTIPVGNEEDVSFSDLEDDDDVVIPIKSKSIEC